MQFDYIAFYIMLGFVVLSPVIKTNTIFDYLTYPLYTYILFQIFLREHGQHFVILNALDKEAFMVMSYLLIFILLLKSGIKTKTIHKGLSYLFITNVVLTLVLAIGIKTFINCNNIDCIYISGLIPNKSMNSILNCMLYPFFITYKFNKKTKYVFTTLLVLTVFMSLSSTAFACLLTIPLSYLLFVRPRDFVKYCIPIILAGAFVGLVVVKDFFNPFGRFEVYQFYLSKLSIPQWIYGLGPGSFGVLGVKFQKDANFLVDTQGWFIYMHSDVAQVIFEYGLLGFIPCIYLLFQTLTKADLETKIAVCVTLVGAVFYYPFHFPFHLFIIFLILKMIANKLENSYGI